MKTYTLKQISACTGIVMTRLVGFYKTETRINGDLIKSDIDDEGNRVWWLEPSPTPNTKHGQKIHAEAAAKRTSASLTLEDAKELRREKGPAAVDVAKLTPEDKAAFLAWLKEPQVTMSEDAEEDVPASEIIKEWLVAIDGIGSKGADDLLVRLKEKGIDTFAKLNAFSDITTFPGIGKKNGENLRAALLAELASTEEEPTKTPREFHPLEKARQGKERAAKAVLVEGEVDILCPFCTSVFDRVPPGAYESCEAACEAPEGESTDDYCDSDFWIEATATGYKTHKFEPIPEHVFVEETESCTYVDGQAPQIGDQIKPTSKADGLKLHGKYSVINVTPTGFVQLMTTEGMFNAGLFLLVGRKVQTPPLVPTLEEVTLEPAPESLIPDGGEPAWPEPVKKAPVDEARAWPEPIKRKKAAVVPMNERLHPALSGCRAVAKPKTHSPEWHAARAAGVGSSDAGAIIGVSPFAGAVDVWKTKLGEEVDRKPWLEEYAEFGTWFEPHIREFCEIEHNIEIIDGADLGSLQSVEWDKALANIDGLDVTNGVVEEYKTTTEKWTTIPPHIEAQVQHQAFVTGVDEIRLRQFVSPIERKLIPDLLEKMRALNPIDADRALAGWLLEHGKIHTWIVERDESYIERMITRQKAFWTFVEMEIEPVEADPEGTADLTNDPDVYASCVEFARLAESFDAQALAFLRAEGVEPSKRGSVSGSAEKVLKAAKTKARKAIDKAVSLLEERPKRLTIGGHSATFVDKTTYSYWNIYTSKGGSDAVSF